MSMSISTSSFFNVLLHRHSTILPMHLDDTHTHTFVATKHTSHSNNAGISNCSHLKLTLSIRWIYGAIHFSFCFASIRCLLHHLVRALERFHDPKKKTRTTNYAWSDYLASAIYIVQRSLLVLSKCPFSPAALLAYLFDTRALRCYLNNINRLIEFVLLCEWDPYRAIVS